MSLAGALSIGKYHISVVFEIMSLVCFKIAPRQEKIINFGL